MLSVFLATVSPMLMMFLCIVIGFVLNRKKLLPENAATVLSKLESYVLVPALIINNFIKYCTISSLAEQYKMILYALIAVLVSLGLAYLLAGRFAKEPYQKNIYKYALTFGNCGFMGNAIVPEIFGEEALYSYLLYTLPLYVVIYTWGISILTPQGETRKNPLKQLLNPTCIALAIGIVLGLLGAEAVVPSFVLSALGSLSSCMGPVAMILTGFVIGNYRVSKLLTNKKVYIASAYRLLLWPTVLLAFLWLIGADQQTLVLSLIAFATPLGLNTVVFPAAYGGDTSTGASMATISHALCVITIPLLYAAFTTIFA